ncbi:MAG: peptide deformylase [Candidatus Taylorbacteria bacterium]|nr:peptide deformylase [Candidatus Taylorbacteria bacterium]
MVTIVQKGDEVLSKIAKEVPENTILSSKIKGIIKNMKIALDSQCDGVAIAAPQIGESLRIFVVSERVLEVPDEASDRKIKPRDDIKKYGHLIFINPTLARMSRDKRMLEEGCLSVRYLYGKIKRSNKATVTAYDENGKKFTRGASGLLAQVFQHEVDHLNGKLFIDSAIEIKDIPPEEWNAGKK